jgi:hypothetical protein
VKAGFAAGWIELTRGARGGLVAFNFGDVSNLLLGT